MISNKGECESRVVATPVDFSTFKNNLNDLIACALAFSSCLRHLITFLKSVIETLFIL